MKTQKKHFFILLALCFWLSFEAFAQTASVSGTLRKWDKVAVQLTLPGNSLTETGNTFRNSRMDVIFTRPDNSTIRVPGFFAADGNAANTNATNGKIFKAYLRPDATGNWSYRVLYYTGTDVASSAVNNLPNPVHDLTGSVGNILGVNASLPDLKAKGRLLYQTSGNNNSRRYLKFAQTGEHFLKFGPDSPENFLDFNEFDFDGPRNNCNLCFQHAFGGHSGDFNNGDPTWDGGKGRNIIGAINYLSEGAQVNAVSMSLFGGDDKNVFPWTLVGSKFIYDVSKLEQWEIVLDHAEKKGLMLHFKLAEAENWFALNTTEINTYYREMVARFGHHLAVEWNIAEEYGSTNTAAASNAANATPKINFLDAVDPWNNHIVIHTRPEDQYKVKYDDFLAQNPKTKLTGASMQNRAQNNWDEVFDLTIRLINDSKNNNTPWVVASDEQAPANSGVFTNTNITTTTANQNGRKGVLWGNLIAGGAGVMWYGGSNGDFRTEDYRRFATPDTWARNAITGFFKGQNIPFWEMENNDNLISGNNNHCLAKAGEQYVVYLPSGGNANLNLNGQTGNFQVRWFNPRNGGSLTNGNTIVGGGNRALGTPPNTTGNDWVALVTSSGGTTNVSVTGVNLTPATLSLTAGTTGNLTGAVVPSNATNQTMTFTSNNTSVATVNQSGVVTAIAAGTATITARTTDGDFTDTTIVTVTASAGGCTADFEEVNGLVVIEAENLNNVGATNWTAKTAVAGFTGASYLSWDGANQFSTPGTGLITATIKINDPGEYRFQWRSKVGMGTNATEHNDSWLRFPDADDFFGRKGTGVIYPNGSGQTPNPAGASSDGWFKIYLSGSTDWTWVSKTSDNDGHDIFVQFDNPGTYTIEISGRSKDHLIDRIVLFKSSVTNATALTTNETPCTTGGNTVAVTGVSVSQSSLSLNVGQTSDLNATVTPNNATNTAVSWASSNTSVATVNNNGLVTAIAAGSANITVTTSDGDFQATSVVTVTAAGGGGDTTVTLSPIHDAYLQGTTLFNTTILRLENNNRTGYLMYDLSGITGTISAASLTFIVNGDAGSGNLNVNLGTSNNWTETNLSDANKPATGLLLGSINQTYAIGNSKTIPLTAASISGNTVSLILAPTGGNDFAIASKENSVDGPQLTITYNSGGTTTIPVTGVSVSQSSLSLNVGQTSDLNVTVTPNNATDNSVTWSSSNTNVATVNNNGLVTAVAAGTADIKVTTSDGDFAASSTVTIIGGVSSPTTTTLSPIHDAYLQGSANFNSNVLRIESGNRVGYLMYDLSGVNGTITNAELKMTCNGDSGNGNINVNLGSSSNWTETNLTTGNRPNADALLGSLNSNYTIGTSYTWNLNASTLSGGGNVSLVVAQTGGNDAAFASKENAATEPQLVITYRPSAKNAIKKDIAKDNTIFYASPYTRDQGDFKIDILGDEKAQIRIFNLNGSLVYKASNIVGKQTVSEQYFKATGLYIVRVITNTSSITAKLIVK